MTEVRVETELALPPEPIFDELADHARYDRFRPIATSALVRDGAVHNGVGALRRLTAGRWHFEEEITEFERPGRLGYRIIETNIPLEHDGGSIRLEPSGTGTHVLWVSRFRATVPLAPGLAGALMAASLRRSFRQMLEDAERLSRESGG